MKFGVFMFTTDYAIQPAELAREVEARGFDSLFVPEHTHIPASRQTAWPGGAELPQEYWHTHDPFIALAAAAAVTERILLGTGISLVVEHDPIVQAKVIASLDMVSNGRVVFGIGGGWNREEMENHGTDYSRRWKVLRERVEAMKAIWTEEEAEYHGEFVDFDPIWSYPKPVQKPHPPVLVGGDGPNTLNRVVRYGDGWMPIVGRGNEGLRDRMRQLQDMAAEAGRASIPVWLFGARPDDTLPDFEEAGAEHAILSLPSAPASEVIPRLDNYAKFAEEYNRTHATA